MKKPEGKYQKTSAGTVKMQPKAEELKFVTKSDGYVHIHPSSVNYQVGILFLSAKHAIFYKINHLCLIIYDYSKGSY